MRPTFYQLWCRRLLVLALFLRILGAIVPLAEVAAVHPQAQHSAK